MHFNSHAYKSFHHRAWERCHELLYVNGLFLLNVSDFIAKGEVVHASAWHLLAMRDAGFKLVRTYDMPTPRMRFGANANARVEFEHVHVFRKVAS